MYVIFCIDKHSGQASVGFARYETGIRRPKKGEGAPVPRGMVSMIFQTHVNPGLEANRAFPPTDPTPTLSASLTATSFIG